MNDPTQPPYGNGLVVDFHASAANDTFTYSGSGLPDTTDTQVQFQHKEAQAVTFNFAIGVTTAGGKVTSVQVTSAAVAPAALAGTVITIAVGPGNGFYRFHLVNLAELISTLAGDTLSSITGFVVTLSAPGDLYFDNFSAGNVQPTNSLAFSYDTYYGLVDQAYIRAGAMGWVCYAYCIYMQITQDFSPALYLQRMINFLLTLQSTASDLTNGLFYLGWGTYENPGYQFVPGLMQRVSTEHQIDLYFAFMRSRRNPAHCGYSASKNQFDHFHAGGLAERHCLAIADHRGCYCHEGGCQSLYRPERWRAWPLCPGRGL